MGLQIIHCGVSRDSSRPGTKSALWVEARVRFVDPPEGLDRKVFSDTAIAHDTHRPTEDFALIVAEENLEIIDIPAGEVPYQLRWLIEDFHLIYLYTLTAGREGRLQENARAECPRGSR